MESKVSEYMGVDDATVEEEMLLMLARLGLVRLDKVVGHMLECMYVNIKAQEKLLKL